jgi:hypothetical protein
MPKTTGVKASRQTEENRFGEMTLLRLRVKTLEWVREIPVKDKLIRLSLHMVRRVTGKADLLKIKDDLPTTLRWIRVIGVDHKVDLKKIKIVLPKVKVSLQCKARMIRDHTRWTPEENRTGENPKVEENRKIRLPILHSRKILQYNLHLL